MSLACDTNRGVNLAVFASRILALLYLKHVVFSLKTEVVWDSVLVKTGCSLKCEPNVAGVALSIHAVWTVGWAFYDLICSGGSFKSVELKIVTVDYLVRLETLDDCCGTYIFYIVQVILASCADFKVSAAGLASLERTRLGSWRIRSQVFSESCWSYEFAGRGGARSCEM